MLFLQISLALFLAAFASQSTCSPLPLPLSKGFVRRDGGYTFHPPPAEHLKRIVYNPHITTPNSHTVWTSGTQVEVEW